MEGRKKNYDVLCCVLLLQSMPETIARTIAERMGSDPELWKLAQVSRPSLVILPALVVLVLVTLHALELKPSRTS
jgi:hypothetical protein